MKLLITGANGFLGRYTVAEALRKGHAVRVIVRSPKDAGAHGWDANPNVEVAVADLRRRKGLADVVRGVDAVLHLAASKGGDLYTQFGGTVVATENLLSAMDEAGVRKIVLISSFAIYDYPRIPGWSVIDENAALAPDFSDRDEYTHTKLVQEKLVREHATKAGWDFTVLRPGVIYGKDNLWSARLGIQGKKVWIRMGAWARVPLTYVENVADAIILAAERADAGGKIFNVVDDEMPSQRQYIKVLKKRLKPKMVIPIAWTVMRALAGGISVVNRLFLGNQAKVPGFLVTSRLQARAKPFRYSNASIKQGLGWKPRFGLSEALDRSLSAEPIPAANLPESGGPSQRLPRNSADLMTVGPN